MDIPSPKMNVGTPWSVELVFFTKKSYADQALIESIDEGRGWVRVHCQRRPGGGKRPRLSPALCSFFGRVDAWG